MTVGRWKIASSSCCRPGWRSRPPRPWITTCSRRRPRSAMRPASGRCSCSPAPRPPRWSGGCPVWSLPPEPGRIRSPRSPESRYAWSRRGRNRRSRGLGGAAAVHGARVWAALLEAGARPVGPTASESLRVETGTPRWGTMWTPPCCCPRSRSKAWCRTPRVATSGRKSSSAFVTAATSTVICAAWSWRVNACPLRAMPSWPADSEIGRVTSAAWSFGLKRPLTLGLRAAPARGARHPGDDPRPVETRSPRPSPPCPFLAERGLVTNRLADETSPYLLQHAHNPVDWYPWGDEAFARAQRGGQADPALRRLFGVPLVPRDGAGVVRGRDIARLMNEHFVSVKVDREERPDVDQIYMQAVQAMSGHGGWPMTVFLTPEGEPFYGGTYSPPGPSTRHCRRSRSSRTPSPTPGARGEARCCARRRELASRAEPEREARGFGRSCSRRTCSSAPSAASARRATKGRAARRRAEVPAADDLGVHAALLEADGRPAAGDMVARP